MNEESKTQGANAEHISALVSVRNHLQTLLETNMIRKEDYRQVSSVIKAMDQEIVNSTLALYVRPGVVLEEAEPTLSQRVRDKKAAMKNDKKEVTKSTLSMPRIPTASEERDHENVKIG